MEIALIHNGYNGFFSDCFRILESYMECKELNITSNDWFFGHTLGWNDYFTTFSNTIPTTRLAKDDDSNKKHTVADYKKAIGEIFVYQPYILKMVEDRVKELDLNDYVAVFIRRGDKLLGESALIPTQFYVMRALAMNPSTIFVQTDDYRAFEEFQDLVHQTNPEIRVITTCPSNKFGMFFVPLDMNQCRCQQFMIDGKQVVVDTNIQYLKTNTPQKALYDYTKPEIREHVEEMLVGILICQRASYVAMDHMSNVARYIAFSHPRGKDAILAIEDMNICLSPTNRLIPRYDYDDSKYIRNPRYHSIYNEYI